MTQSKQQEDQLQRLPRPSVERAATAAVIEELQSQIQTIDVQLSYAPESGLKSTEVQSLWRVRAQLLAALVEVRRSEVIFTFPSAHRDPGFGVTS
jgi:hypothetical protein